MNPGSGSGRTSFLGPQMGVISRGPTARGGMTLNRLGFSAVFMRVTSPVGMSGL